MRSRGRGTGRRRYSRNQPPERELTLSGMTDIFTNMLLFLLITFSADPGLLYGAADLVLPKSVSQDPIDRSVQVAVTADKVLIDGKEVLAGLPEYLVAEDVLMLPPVYDMLVAKKEQLVAKERAKAAEAGAPPPPPAAEGAAPAAPKPWEGSVIIQADKDITFNALKRVMYTADRAGFTAQQLALLGVSR